jgi:filamentous hemagglutinin family protein
MVGLLIAMFPFLGAKAQGMPSGGQVVAGAANIGGTANGMLITQLSDRAIINWNNFSIANKGSVRIENGKGATLNRVTGSSVSNIDGLLSATGSVYLINKNGIVVGKTGQIDVGGRFVGSTQDMSNQSFLAGGSQTLAGASEAPILNYGKIGSLGGDVALIASKVENQGTITAEKGTVGLLAGYQVILRDQALNDGKFSVVVGGAGTSATNSGAINAAEAELRAQGGNVYALAGNTGGIINARGVTTTGGRIFLSAGEGGEVQVAGAVTASKADGKGGAIEVSGTHILLDDGAKLDASGTTGGSVLVGGDWQGGADASKTVADHAVAHADAVVMRGGALIDVTGSQGAGGKAVLWSDKYTNFLGNIRADGATNGGMVETSSKINLQAFGAVSAKGLSGAAGQWLLDPADVTIGTGSPDTLVSTGFTDKTYTPQANGGFINAATINATLNGGGSVVVTTTSDAAYPTTQNGDITLAAGTNITKTAGADASLTLQANRNIILNGNISSTAGKLNVNLNSRSAGGATAGSVTMAGNITTLGGDLNVYGGASAAAGVAAGNGTSDGVFIGNSSNSVVIDAGGGNISMSGTSVGTGVGVRASASQIKTSGAGTIALTGATTNNNSGISLENVSTTQSGVRTVDGAIALNGTSSSGAGLYVGTSTVAASGAGNLGLTGATTSGSAGVFLNAATVSATTGTITGAGQGQINTGEGLLVTNNSTLSTTTGAITLSGTQVAGRGLTLTAGTIQSTSGNIVLTGTNTGASTTINDVGVYLNGGSGTSGFSVSTGGDVSLSGTSRYNVGLYRDAAAVNSITGRNVTLTGSSTDATASGEGVLLQGSGVLTVTGTNSIAISGTGGGTRGRSGGSVPSAVAFGINNNALQGSFNAGAGGFAITGNALSGSGLGVDTLGVGGAIATGLNVTSAGSVNLSSNGGIFFRGTINQTGGGNSVISSSATNSTNGITLGNYNGTGGGSLTLSTTGYVSASGYLRSAGDLNVSGTNLNIAGSVSAGGAATLNATSSSVTTGAVTINGNTASIIKSATSTVTTGAIALGGNGDLTLDAANFPATAAITKTGTGASTLKIRSAQDVTVTNAITSTGGALNIALNSRSAGAAEGSIVFSAVNVTTKGGNVTGFGGVNGDEAAKSSTKQGVNFDNANIDAGGGDIRFWGATSTTSGSSAVASGGLEALKTSGTGAINVKGDNTGSGLGVNIGSGTLTAGTGGISVTGTSVSNSGLYVGSNLTTTGDLNLSGTSTTGFGLNAPITSAISWQAANINVTGNSTGGSTSKTGVWLNAFGSNSLSIKATNKLTINATGGGANGPDDTNNGKPGQTALVFGNDGSFTNGGTNTGTPKVTMDAGIGGVVINATNSTQAGNAIDSWPTSNQTADSLFIKSAGAVTMTANDDILFRGSIQQTGGGDSLVRTTSGDVVLGGFTSTNAGAVSLTSTSSHVRVFNPLSATTDLTISAANGVIDAAALSAGRAVAISSKGYMTLGSLTQSGASGTVNLTSSTSGNVTVGTVNLATNDATLIKSATGSTLVFNGGITTAGNGDITLDSGADLNTPLITKTAAATGTSALTLRALGTVNVNNGIVSNGGALNVDLNARTAGGTDGRVYITSGITTKGGNILAHGGAGTTGAAISTSGVEGVMVAGALNAGGGDITLIGQNTAGAQPFADGVGVRTGGLTTTAAGKITVTGTSTAGYGINFGSLSSNNTSVSNTSSAAGTVTMTGTSGTITGINLAGATITSGNGGLNLTGTSTTGSGTAITAASNVSATGTGTVTISGATTAAAGSATATGQALLVDSATITAATGAVSLSGQTQIGGDSLAFQGTSSVTTTSGNISLTGTNVPSRGLMLASGTIRSTTGNVTLSGTNNSTSTSAADVGLYMPGNGTAFNVTTGGDVAFVGNSRLGVGIYRDSNTAGTIAGRNVSFTGTSSSAPGVSQQQGVVLGGTGVLTVNASNGVTITGTGAGSRNATVSAAVTFGRMAINAGAGGVNITGNTAAYGGAAGIDSVADSAFDSNGSTTVNSNLSITSAGGVNLTSDRALTFRGAINQTGGGNSTITGQSNIGQQILINGFNGTGGGNLAVNGGWFNSLANMKTAGDLAINTLGLTQVSGTVTTGGSLNVLAAADRITISGATTIGGNTASTLKTGTGLTTGAISLTGSGDLTLDSVAAYTAPAITKSGAGASGASTLTIKSASDITVGNAITSSAGALNVNLNSRSGGAATGTVYVGSNITTQGGNIAVFGGTNGAVVASGASPAFQLANASTLSAGGGNISVTAANTGNDFAIRAYAGGSFVTSGQGSITLSGTSSGSGGVRLSGNTQTDTGAITITGSGNQGVQITPGAQVKTGSGAIAIQGTGVNDAGVWFDTATVTSSTGNVAIQGSSTAAEGVLVFTGSGPSSFTTSGAGSLAILGTGGATAFDATRAKAAISLGNVNAPATVTIGAGTGGLTMKGTGATGAAYSIYSNVVAASAINSAGAIDMSGNNLDVLLGGTITQTGTQASTISSTGGNVTIGQGGGATAFGGPLTMSGKNLVVGGTLSDAGALSMTATQAITTGVISQPASTNTGGLTLNAGTALNTGAINWATGNMSLTSVSDMTTNAITKLAGAAGTSSLAVKTDGNLIVNGAIGAGTGAGPLNITLNNRAHDAATGTITLNAGLNSAGGNILLRGGSAAATTPVDPTVDNAGFVTALIATGTQFFIGTSGAINAAGGDIELRGASATGSGMTLNQGLATTGAGNIRLYGLGGTGNTAAGVDVTGTAGAISTVNGNLTIIGATRSTGSGAGVIVENNGSVVSSGGSIAVSGAGSTASTAGSLGVAVAGATNTRIAVTGGAGTLAVNGQGGSGAGSFGVGVTGSSGVGTIASASSGAVTINGTGGAGSATTNYGIYLDQGSSATPVINTTGAGNVTLSGITQGSTAYGIFTSAANGAKIGTSTATGNLTLLANKMALGGATPATLDTKGLLTLAPQAGGTFTVDGDILPAVFAANAYRGAYSGVVFGSATGGALTFKTTAAANTYTKALTLASAGNITISGTNPLTANGGLVLAGNGGLNQTVDLITPQVSGTASAVYLMNSGNQIGVVNNLAVTGDTSLYSSTALTVKGTNTSTTALLRSASDLTLDAGSKITATGFGSALNLVTAGKFINNSGASALATPGGRWLVWSRDQTADTNGGLNYAFIQHGGGYGATTPAQSTGNGLIDGNTPTASISLIGKYAREYDGTTTANLGQTNFKVDGLVAGEVATVYSTATFDDKNVNLNGVNKTITADDLALIVRNNGIKVYGYTLTDNRITGAIGQIDQKLLTAALQGSTSKVYDSTTSATLASTNYALSGVLGNEVVTLNGPTVGTYFDKNAGTNKLITATGLSLTGVDAGNYKVANTVQGNIGVITARAISASLTGTVSKVYDGTTTASISASQIGLNGVLGTDVVYAANDLTGAYADKNANTGKRVTANGVTLAGADAANYTVTSAAQGDVGTITAKGLLLAAVGDNKTYDGTTASTGIVRATGLVGTDSVNATQVFDSANASTSSGAGRTLQVANGYVVSDGNNGLNYTVHLSEPVAGSIAKRLVTTQLNASGKVYDGTTDATGTFTALDNTVLNDNVTLDTSAGKLSFLDRNAGAGKAVTAAGYSLTGAAAANYTLGAIGNGAATIGKAALTLTAATDSKVYDGTVSSNKGAGITAIGLKKGDELVSATQKFTDKNANETKTLTVDSWNIADGNGGNNYTVTSVDNNTGTIAQKMISGRLTDGITKTYDGTTSAVLSGTALDGIVAGDAVTVAATSAAYAQKNVGNGIVVTVSGMSLGGADSANYVLESTDASGAVGFIKARQVNVVSSGSGAKTYDGTIALANGQLNTLQLAADDATTRNLMDADGVKVATGAVTGTLADRNAGTSKAVSLTGFGITGNDLGNYVLVNTTAQGVADVARKALALNAAIDSKTYDGSTASAAFVQQVGLVAGDTFAATQKFDSKDAGNRSLVVDSATINDGNKGGNYDVTNYAAAGVIDKRLVGTTVNADSKVYDGTTTATGTFTPVTNLVAGESVGVTGKLTFADRNFGLNKAVTVTSAVLSGTDSRNYTLNPVANGVADIAKANLVLTAGADTRQYDGTTASTGKVVAVGLGAGDSFTATQRFKDKNAGDHALSVDAGYTVTDGNSGQNYIISTADTIGTITKRVLDATVTVDTKVYDGTTAATGTVGALSNVVDGETVTLANGVLAFADRNAGVNKAVTVTGATLAGDYAANYTLASVATGTGTITPKALLLSAVADTRAYDGTTASAGQVAAQGLVAGDGYLATQVFDGKNATEHTLQVANYTVLDGNSGGNYTVTLDKMAVGRITTKVLNASVVINDKVYDGNTNATGRFDDAGLTGVVAGDAVSVDSASGKLAFVDRNAGNGKAVTVSGVTLTGADAGNYALSNIGNGAANISKKALTVTAVTDSKVYDSTTASSGKVTYDGLIDGDTATAVQVFQEKNQGTRGLTVTNLDIVDGNGGGNYEVTKVGATGSISQKQISGALTGTVSKVYDGTTAATLLPTNLSGVYAGDAVTVSAASATYDDKNVNQGNVGKLVTVSGMTLNGADAGNYVLDSTSASANVGTITARAVTVGVTGAGSKTYDGATGLTAAQLGSLAFTAANGDAATQALLAQDMVGLDATAVTGQFADRNFGTNKGVTLTGYTLGNNASGNYVLANDSVQGLANIAKAVLTMTAAADAKVYDGTTASTGLVTIGTMFGADTATATQAFDLKGAGPRQLIVNSFVVNDGNNGENYTVKKIDATGDISKKQLSGSLIGSVSKMYDGTDTATLLGANLAGVVAGDVVNVTATSAKYDNKNVNVAGVNKTVTVSGMALSGTDAGNYLLDRDSASADVGTILARTVSVSTLGTGTKTYDGSTDVSAANMGGLTFQIDAASAALMGADGVALDAAGMSGTLVDRNAGSGKSATLTGYTLTNNALNNYVLANGSAQGVLDVKRATLTLSAVGETKVYDGTTASAGLVVKTGLVGTDSATATQVFDDKNANSRNLIVNSFNVVDGNNGGNYDVIKVDAAGLIEKRTVSSVVSANNKTYDGTTAATGTFEAISNLVAGDDLAVTADLAFLDKNADTDKKVTVSNARLTGGAAGNYTLSPVAVSNNLATIYKANLILTAGTDTKVYDGNTTSTGTVGVIGLVTGDTVGATQHFNDKNANDRNLLVVDAGYTVTDGNNGGNYAISLVSTAGAITKRELTTGVNVDTRVYDGTTAATGGFTDLTNKVGDENVFVTGGTLAFADRNAGNGKVVNVSGATLGGADAANYTLASLTTGAGTITKKDIVLNAVADSRAYDATTASSGRVTADGMVAGDGFTATQVFNGKDAGDHTLEVANYTLFDGNNGNNYTVSKFNTALGNIGKKSINATVSVDNKVYDTTISATGAVTGLLGVLNDEDVIWSGAGKFAFVDRNAGNGKAVTVTGLSLAGAGAGNYELSAAANGTANIAKAALTLTAVSDSKAYDGTTASIGQVIKTGLLGEDTATVTQAFDIKDAATTRTLKVNGWTIADGNGGGNYEVTAVDASGVITKKQLAGSLTGTVSKVYDGTVNAVLAGANLEGVIAGDVVAVSAAQATFDNKNFGENKIVTVSGMQLSGADAANYELGANQASAKIGSISARQVGVETTGSGVKTYDGTTTLTNGQIGNIALAASDSATRELMAADGVGFDTAGMSGVAKDRNAGTGKIVTLSGYTLANNDLGNYVVAGSAQGVANVGRKTLTLTAGADSKTYDGNTTSTGSVTQAGLVAGDTFSATQKFDGKDAGNRTMVVENGVAIDGNNGGNYAVVTETTAGFIAKRLITTAVTANDKVYDGTTAATGTFGALTNLVAGETVGVTGTLNFADRNAEEFKAVQVSNAVLTGAEARNYELSPVTNALARISKASLVLTAGADSRQYDGTTASSGTVTAAGLGFGDSFTATQKFDGKDAATRKLSIDAGYTVNDGNNGGNYIVTTADSTGTITKRVLSTSVNVDTKEYDGTTAATGTFGALTNGVAGEAVTVTGGTLAFADRNAGNAKAVNVTGATLGGADAANYTLASVASGTGAITQKALVLNAVYDTRAYDGTTASTGRVTAQGLVSGDGFAATQAFDGKDARDHLIQVANYSVLDGNNGGNYIVTLGEKVLGNISKKVLNATATVNNKTYDGTIAATGNVSGLAGVVGTEDVTVNGSGLFAFVDRNAGNGKAVTLTGLTLSGTDAGNYTLSDVANGTANIARAKLTLTASGDSKTYDGTTASSGVVSVTGLVDGDTATATQAFDSKAAKDRILIANSWDIQDGNNGGNYTVEKVTAAGYIAQKQLSGALTGTVSKVYDGTATATLLGANLAGVVAGDAVTVSATDTTYDDKNVNSNADIKKLVTVSGMSLSGVDASNYLLDSTSASAYVGTITARTVTIDVDGRGAKTYDGTTALNSDQLGSLKLVSAKNDAVTQQLMANDNVAFNINGVTGVLADRNAGTGKSVVFNGYTLTGNDLNNYVLASSSALGVADIARAQLTLTASSDSKVYDGTTASAGAVAVSGLIAGDTATATQAFDNKSAGGRIVTVGSRYVVNDGNKGGNYDVSLVDAKGEIDKRLVSTTLTVQDKTYDGTTAATGSFSPLANVVAGDNVGVSATLNFADRNADLNKVVTIGNSTLTGTDAANYALDPLASTGTAAIRQASLVLNAVTDVRQYDGTTTSAAQVQALGLVAGDTLAATQSFDGKNAAAHTLSVDGGYVVNDGNSGKNYLVTVDKTASGAITQRVLTASATVADKTYDGSTTANGSLGNLTGKIGDENVELVGGTLSFADRNAGLNKAVNVNGAALSGADAGNYILSAVAGGTATINRASLVLNATGDTKVYDGTKASGGKVTAVGLVNGDSFAATQSFGNKNAGQQVITVDGASTVYDGNGGNNYTVTIGDSATGLITPKQVQVSSSVNSKTYDGTTVATGSITGLTGVISGDQIGLDGAAQFAFADRNAGNGKAVTVSGVGLKGADAGNYVVGSVANGTANIAKAVLTLTASGQNKGYDGTTASTGKVDVKGLVAGDTATANQAFDSKNAGDRKLVANVLTLEDGNGGANYTVTKVDAAGAIARKLLTGAVTGTVSKTYDGTTAATLLPVNLDGVVAGDVLTLTVAGADYADKNVGLEKLVTVSGMALSGLDAGNYELLSNTISSKIGTISARAVTIGSSGTGVKTYDGTTVLGNGQFGTLQFVAANGDTATQNMLAADGVALDMAAVSGQFADRNAGTGKLVDLAGFGLTNNASGNYVLAGDAVRVLANINRAQLTLTAAGDSKMYDGTTASASQVRVSGLVTGDTASATQLFDNQNAGDRRLKIADYTLNDGNRGVNYDVTMVDAAGTILQRDLLVKLDDASKIAGTIDPGFTYTVGGSGLIAGDSISGVATRDSGEAVGNYAIKQGSLSAGANYAMNVALGNMTINAGATTPGTVTPPVTDPGTGTTPVNPGTGTTPVNPGTGTTPVNPGTGTTPGTVIPPVTEPGTGTTPGTVTPPVTEPGTGTTPVNPGTGTTPVNPGTGATPGTGTNPGTGNGPIGGNTGAVIAEQLNEIQERATRQTAGSFGASVTLQAGVAGGFDASTGFGSNGTSRLPGSTLTLEQALAALREGREAVKPVVCEGAADKGACESANDAGLPYPTNRVLSSVMRFFKR